MIDLFITSKQFKAEGPLAAAPGIFAGAPAQTNMAILTIYSGEIRLKYGGNAPSGTEGAVYGPGNYTLALADTQLKAIGASGAFAGWVSYWRVGA